MNNKMTASDITILGEKLRQISGKDKRNKVFAKLSIINGVLVCFVFLLLFFGCTPEINVYKGNGDLVNLVDNPIATNTTYTQLINFIIKDETDELEYVDGGPDNFSCIDFAELIHNNAEAVGIKAGLVIIEFENNDVGHALNVFNTLDRGLVFIDCTGGKLSNKHWVDGRYIYTVKIPPPTYYTITPWGETDTNVNTDDEVVGWDTIAYLEEGNEYGVIDISSAKSLEYTFYIEYTKRWDNYQTLVEEYNSEVSDYNKQVWEWNLYGYLYGSQGEYTKLMRWDNELEQKERELNKAMEGLGKYYYYLDDENKIVSSYVIYWGEDEKQEQVSK